MPRETTEPTAPRGEETCALCSKKWREHYDGPFCDKFHADFAAMGDEVREYVARAGEVLPKGMRCPQCETALAEMVKANDAADAAEARLSAQDTEIARLTEHNKNLLVEGALANAALVDFRAEIARLRDALTQIKGAVCGERNPRWTNDWATTSTRGWIADVCDAVLTPPPPSEDDHA